MTSSHTNPIHTPAWVKQLQQLCEIDSTTEAGAAGATEVSSILGSALKSMGFELSWHAPWASEGRRGKHLIATRNASAARHLLLVGHSDTVLSPNEAPFRVDHTNGKLYGAGVCDMKGGDVLMLSAVREALAQSAAVNDLGLVVLMNCAEENASPSFRALTRPWADQAIACLGFEPARPGVGKEQLIVSARKGSVRFELTCHGKAAHAGNAHQAGVSAIRELARKIEAIESLTDYSRDITANVGIIQGGLVVNQIAPQAKASFEIRAFEQKLLESMGEQARAICSSSSLKCPADGQPTRMMMEELAGFPAWQETQADKQLSLAYIQIAKRHGLEVTAIASGGGSDASQFSPFIPTIDGLGILGGAMHSTDEWADMHSFEARMHSASQLIMQLASQK